VSVLLVEDSATDTFIIRHALAASSAVQFEVTHVTRVADAEEQLKKSSFDLVITDFGLPDSQGLETLRRIRRLGVGVPIVVLTSIDDDALGIQALREGAHDYLVKGQLTPRAVARAARYAIDKKEHQEKLRQSQKLEAVGRLAAGIAHDFNNVLTIVRGNAELISEGDDPAEIKEAAREIREASDRAIALARQLLTFSRQQAMHQKPLDLNAVVGDFTRMLRRLLGDSIKLELRLASELPRIKADNGMLEQVLLNLGVNARDAMPFGGKLCVQTQTVELSREAAQAYPQGEAGMFVKLSVSDTGSGMPPEVLSRIFEPFFTTKSKNQGTGLGLATVHGIVHQHHGFIAVNSRPEVGTTFEIFLPAMEPAVAAPSPPSVRPMRRGGGETILLVEDEDVLRRLAERVLGTNGYRVFSAASAEEARALFGEHRADIQLLLTDMVLPDRESGKILAETLTAASPTLRVVFMSGYSPDFIAEGFVLEEGVNFLQKPFHLAYLLETVKQRLESDVPHSPPHFASGALRPS
jgi:signal transduction histidine kinase